MIKITFIEPTGTRREVSADVGQSVMQVAIESGVEGITAECGGSCMCATCHCLVVEAAGEIPAMESVEADTLEFAAEEQQDSSRLVCQIDVTPELDGSVFRVVGG